MMRFGISLVAATILFANGALEGLCTNRWFRSVELETGASKLMRVPMTIGEWKAQSDELDATALARAGIDSYLFRHYENQFSGKKVTMLLMCGRPGPLAVHTPDICYRGAGFNQDGPVRRWQQKYGSALTSAEFSRAKFSKVDATDGTSVGIEWSWGAEGQWLVKTNPRAAFARLPVLYKLYIVQTETPSSERSDEIVCKRFLEQMLPALDDALFTAK